METQKVLWSFWGVGVIILSGFLIAEYKSSPSQKMESASNQLERVHSFHAQSLEVINHRSTAYGLSQQATQQEMPCSITQRSLFKEKQPRLLPRHGAYEYLSDNDALAQVLPSLWNKARPHFMSDVSLDQECGCGAEHESLPLHNSPFRIPGYIVGPGTHGRYSLLAHRTYKSGNTYKSRKKKKFAKRRLISWTGVRSSAVPAKASKRRRNIQWRPERHLSGTSSALLKKGKPIPAGARVNPASANAAWKRVQQEPLFSWPVEPHQFWISSQYGPRKNPNGRWGFHAGLDMAAMRGTPVRAAGEGMVLEAAYNSGYGNYILIAHKGKFRTRYAHLDKILVRVGQRVTVGDYIGRVGATGFVRKSRWGGSGSHLHFEVYMKGKPVNPFYFLA